MTQADDTGVRVSEARLGNTFRVSRGYLNYVIAVLWVVMLLRFVDLQIVAVLLESNATKRHPTRSRLELA